MAKELPYFKFEPNAFDSGRIQMCSMEAQGLFVNICCLYWSRLGDLPEKLAMQKLCKSYADAYTELKEEQVLSIENGLIIIEFLDEQLKEAGSKSDQAKEAARKRWAKYRQNMQEMRTHSESKTDAMPIEENRREEKRKEESIISLVETKQPTLQERLLNFCLVVDGLIEETGISREAAKAFCDYWTEHNEGGKKMLFEMKKTFNIKRRLNTWKNNETKFASNKQQPQNNIGTVSDFMKDF